uniref:Cadherin domain-containing protein n=1 Tax=Anopheles merus TaxID=30066 RepID=A0A182UQG9_ANOME
MGCPTCKSYKSSSVRYRISSGNVGNVFAIRHTTGTLYVVKALDYEKIKKYALRLTASENFQENYTAVLINVRDVNDDPPVFEKSSYRTQITEEDDRGLPKRVLRGGPTLLTIQNKSVNKVHVSYVLLYQVSLVSNTWGIIMIVAKVNASDANVERPNNIIYFLTGPGIDIENLSASNFKINKAMGEICVLKVKMEVDICKTAEITEADDGNLVEDKFTTQIQLRLCTHETYGDLFRISDQHMREYGIIELKGAKVYFRYTLNGVTWRMCSGTDIAAMSDQVVGKVDVSWTTRRNASIFTKLPAHSTICVTAPTNVVGVPTDR